MQHVSFVTRHSRKSCSRDWVQRSTKAAAVVEQTPVGVALVFETRTNRARLAPYLLSSDTLSMTCMTGKLEFTLRMHSLLSLSAQFLSRSGSKT
jgi:hypothetical protein